jgi:HlyD family secretion protein
LTPRGEADLPGSIACRFPLNRLLSNMRNIIVAILIATAAAAGWFIGHRSSGTAESVSSDPATSNESAKSPTTIRCQGKLVPTGGIVKILAPVGERVEFLLDKKAGDAISKGEVLVRLFSRNLRKQELELAQARRDDAYKKAEYEKQQANFQKIAANLAVEEADDSGDTINREAQKINLLRTQYKTAIDLLERLNVLKRDPDTEQLIDQTELSKQQLLVDQLAMQIEQGKTDVELAKQAAERARKLAQNQLQAVEYSLKNANQAVPSRSLDAAIELAKAAYNLTEIKSPIDGRILDIIVQEGDSITDRPIMVIANTNQMQCVAEVNDTLIRHIDLARNPSPRVRMTSPALAEVVWGTVVNKGMMISPPSLKDPNPFGSVDRRTGTLTIELDNSDLASQFVNLQVEVEIEVEPGAIEPSQ